MSRSGRRFDQSTIDFPSDRITLGMMRRAELAMFTTSVRNDSVVADIKACDALAWERIFADKLFARLIGAGDPHQHHQLEQIVSTLHHCYLVYGISSDLDQTRAIVKGLENQVAQQANPILSRGR